MQRRLACCDYSGWKFSDKPYFRVMCGQVSDTLPPAVDVCDAQVTSTISSHAPPKRPTCMAVVVLQYPSVSKL
jgi:hypothetical protein